MQRMNEVGRSLGLPDLNAGGYLLEALFQVGPMSQTQMGEAPLNWQELALYGHATQALSEPWEYQALFDMSRAYMAARRSGENPFSISPVDQKAQT